MPKSGLFYKIESAAAFAEELSADSTDRWAARRISDELLPALYQARTFVEVGQVTASEVAESLSKASYVASEMADADAKYARLFSRLRVLQEEVFAATRARRK